MSDNYDPALRPKGGNADEWLLFLEQYLDNRANGNGRGLEFMAVQISTAIEGGKREPQQQITAGHPIECIVEVEAWRQSDGDWWIKANDSFIPWDAPLSWRSK